MPVYEVEHNGKTYEVDAKSPEIAARIFAPNLQQTNPGEYDPSSAEYQQKFGSLSDSNFQNARAGFGKAFTDLGRGLKQYSTRQPQGSLWDKLEWATPLGPARKALAQLTGGKTDAQQRADFDQVKQRDSALMNTKSGIAGNITGNVAALLPTAFIPGANTYTGAAAIGGITGALQPVGTNDSRIQNASLGAGGAMAGKYIGGKIGDWAAKIRTPKLSEADAAMAAMANARGSAVGGGSGADASLQGALEATIRNPGQVAGEVGDDVSAGLTRMQREVQQRAMALGMRTTPGQASGSRALQQLEAKLESQPMTSGPFNAIKENNARVLARETAAAIGENADTVDSNVLHRANERLGRIFESVKDDVPRQIDPRGFLSMYRAINEGIEGVVQGFGDNKLVNQLIGMAEKGTATGRELQPLTSKLGKAAYREMTSQSGDRELGQALYRVKDYVDDLLQSGLKGNHLNEFQAARTQYRNLMMITSRVGVLNPSTGNVNGRTLANVLMQKDKAGFLRGQNTSGMYDAARFAQAFPPIVGDSGTATRMPIQGATEMLMRIPYAIGAKAYTSPLSVQLAANAGAAGRATSKAADELIRRPLGTLPFYAPYVLPGAGAVIAPELGR